MKRAIILVRVSTDRQTTDSQRDEMIKFAQGNGYQLDECHLIERHESATKKEESQVVMELKDVIQNGGIEVVFTFELSRLSRRVEYLEDIKNLFIKYNIKLICKIEGVFNFNENTDLSQLIIFDVFKNLCQQEGIIRKERFARGKKAMFENNLYTGGKILYGYSVVNKNFVVNEAEAKVVRMIFDAYVYDKISVTKIHNRLLNNGINLTKEKIAKIMECQYYTGEKLKAKYKVHAKKYPPIISVEIWKKLRQMKEQQIDRLIDTSSVNITLSAKLVHCGCCNSVMSPKHSNTERSIYFCSNRRAAYVRLRTKECTDLTFVNLDVIDSLALNIACRNEYHFLKKMDKQKIIEIQNQIKQLQTQLKNLDKKFDVILKNKMKDIAKLLPHFSESDLKSNAKIAIKDVSLSIESEKLTVKNQLDKLTAIVNEYSITDRIKQRDNDRETMSRRQYIAKYMYQFKEYIIDMTKQQMYDVIHKYIQRIEVKNISNTEKRIIITDVDNNVHTYRYMYRQPDTNYRIQNISEYNEMRLNEKTDKWEKHTEKMSGFLNWDNSIINYKDEIRKYFIF